MTKFWRRKWWHSVDEDAPQWQHNLCALGIHWRGYVDGGSTYCDRRCAICGRDATFGLIVHKEKEQ